MTEGDESTVGRDGDIGGLRGILARFQRDLADELGTVIPDPQTRGLVLIRSPCDKGQE